MSRFRIYELAKEAGMESKVLAEQLIELGYNIKSHSSTVEDTVADEIRSKILGTTKTEVVEKRISGKGGATVIRRRARTVRKEPEPVKATEKVEEKPAEAVAEATPAVEVAAKPAEEIAEAATKPTVKKRTVAKADKDEKRPEEEAVVTAEEETPPEPVAGQEVIEQPVDEESPAVTGEAPAEEEKKEPPVKAKPRRGLAKVIKRAAIQIPVEPAKSTKPARPKRAAANGAAMPGRPAAAIPAETDKKFTKKKGKRLVQIQPEAENRIRAKRPFATKRKGRRDMPLNDERPRRGRYGSKSGRGRALESQKAVQDASTPITEAKAIKKRIKVYETISVADIAHRMGVKVNQVIGKLMGLGIMATMNQSLDVDTATLVATDFGYEVEQVVTDETRRR